MLVQKMVFIQSNCRIQWNPPHYVYFILHPQSVNISNLFLTLYIFIAQWILSYQGHHTPTFILLLGICRWTHTWQTRKLHPVVNPPHWYLSWGALLENGLYRCNMATRKWYSSGIQLPWYQHYYQKKCEVPKLIRPESLILIGGCQGRRSQLLQCILWIYGLG